VGDASVLPTLLPHSRPYEMGVDEMGVDEMSIDGHMDADCCNIL